MKKSCRRKAYFKLLVICKMEIYIIIMNICIPNRKIEQYRNENEKATQAEVFFLKSGGIKIFNSVLSQFFFSSPFSVSADSSIYACKNIRWRHDDSEEKKNQRNHEGAQKNIYANTYVHSHLNDGARWRHSVLWMGVNGRSDLRLSIINSNLFICSWNRMS